MADFGIPKKDLLAFAPCTDFNDYPIHFGHHQKPVLFSSSLGETFVADIVIDSSHGYQADPSGHNDSSIEIQRAINDCFLQGGGTCYLPEGEYIVSHRIEIRPFVSLIGKYNGHEPQDGNYGTIIICDVQPTDQNFGDECNIFRLAGSTLLSGLTFYYPKQNLQNVQPYGYTIEIPGKINAAYRFMFTLKNLTFINSYKGICCSRTLDHEGLFSSHEQLYLENIAGTFLHTGFYLTYSSEVGAFDSLVFNASVWAHAPKKYHPEELEQIRQYTYENATALVFGDLEWQQIENVFIDSYYRGIRFTVGDRIAELTMCFIGSFNNLKITGCQYGIDIQEMYIRMGIEFTKSIIEGKESAIANHSPSDKGQVLLAGVKVVGPVIGPNVYFSEASYEEIPLLTIDSWKNPLPRMVLYDVRDYGLDNTGKADVSRRLQALANQIGNEGGGVLYLPSGYYRLEHGVRLGSKTLLLGSGNTICKDQTDNYSLGTVLLAYHGADKKSPDTGEALLTIEGDDSGISSFRIAYPEFNLFSQIYDASSIPAYDFAIRGIGQRIYVTDIYMVNAYNGVDLSKASHYLAKKVMGGFFHQCLVAGGENGIIDTCLSNAIAPSFSENIRFVPDFQRWEEMSPKIKTHLYALSRETNHILKMTGAHKLLIRGLFTYGSRYFIQADDSDFVAYNVGFDSQPPGFGCMFALNNSQGYVLNALRDACGTYGNLYDNSKGSMLSLYNLITLVLDNTSHPDANIEKNAVSPVRKPFGGGGAETP